MRPRNASREVGKRCTRVSAARIVVTENGVGEARGKEEGKRGAVRAFSVSSRVCGPPCAGPVHARARFEPVRGFLDCERVVEEKYTP
jgi:hypothetical protein